MNIRAICKAGIILGLGNYAVYSLTVWLAGGDALHGQIVDGHYLVQAAGGLAEVSRTLFQFSRWEAYSLLATFPLGLLGACFLSPAARPDEAGDGLDRPGSWTAATTHNGR